MGGCCSRPSGPNSPYPDGSPSARAINHPAPDQLRRPSSPPPNSDALAHGLQSSTDPTARLPVQSRRRSRRENQPLDQHINKPLRKHVWSSPHPTWTRATLDRERTDFFDTRVTGRPEVWQTLHAALRVLWDPVGQGAADDGTGGIATAQGLLDAAEVTLPTGNLAQGVYDALGNYYPLPEWVVADPENIVDDDTEGDGDETAKSGGDDAKDVLTAGEDDDIEDIDADETSRRREEKGKAVIDVRDQISVQARLSETSRDISVAVAKTDTVRTLARKVERESGLSATKKVRIAYMGKILKENVSLLDQGWKQGHVVNGLVFNR